MWNGEQYTTYKGKQQDNAICEAQETQVTTEIKEEGTTVLENPMTVKGWGRSKLYWQAKEPIYYFKLLFNQSNGDRHVLMGRTNYYNNYMPQSPASWGQQYECHVIF